MPIQVHRGERGPLALAAATVFFLELADAWSGNAADALYIGRFGPGSLGAQLAISSALLVFSLGIVGMLADRWDRTRFLVSLAAVAAVILLGMRGALLLWPRAPVTFLVLQKQVSAATDLAFWVLIADRFDPRQARRLVPLLAAAGGLGLVAGSFTTDPVARAFGVGELFPAAAGACLVAALTVRALGDEERRRVELPVRAAGAWRAVREGIEATARSELARRLAWIVLIAGALGPVLYTALGAAAASSYGSEAEIAAFFGRFRGVTHLATLGAQSILMPMLLKLFGVGAALLVAPAVALATTALLAARLELATAAVAQGASRLFDAAVQSPGEKLVQNLLSRDVRGRIAAFLDGVAKRCGAVAGGALVTVAIAVPHGLGLLALTVSAAWVLAAVVLWRRYPSLAIDELSQRRGRSEGTEAVDLGSVLQSASLRLRQDLAGEDDQRRAQAIAILVQGTPILAAVELIRAAQANPAARPALLEALDALLLEAGGVEPLPRQARELYALLDGMKEAPPPERAACLSAFGRLADPALLLAERPRLARLAADDAAPAVRLVAQAILARLDGDLEVLDASIDETLGIAAETRLRRAVGVAEARPTASPIDGATASESLRAVALAELRAEAIAGAARGGSRFEARIDALATFARTAAGAGRVAALDALGLAVTLARRTQGAESVGDLARHVGFAGTVAEAALHALSGSLDAPARAAAVRALGSVGDPSSAPTLARALTDRDDRVREAAAAGLAALGPRALPVLLVAARFGTRAARDTALGVLRDLAAHPSTLDDVIDAELGELHQVTLRRASLHGRSDGALGLLADRLDERYGEVVRTLLLVVEVRVVDRRVAEAARRVLAAPEPRVRAQALEALDALLPRHLGRRVVDALDDAPLEARAARSADALGVASPSLAETLRAELEGNDPLARTLAVHALGAAGRAGHRRVIRTVAEAQIDLADPARLLRRILSQPSAEEALEEEDVLSSVQAMLSLRAIPLFGALTPSQLSELAQAVSWETHPPGETILREGERPGALVFVVSGRVMLSAAGGDERELGPGAAIGEGELFGAEFAPVALTAVDKTRLGRLSRVDFERVAEETPGLALAVCRVLYGQNAERRAR